MHAMGEYLNRQMKHEELCLVLKMTVWGCIGGKIHRGSTWGNWAYIYGKEADCSC